jgi:penicillin-binding protein 1A
MSGTAFVLAGYWNVGVYEGLSTLRRAIYRSMNIVTVKTLALVTPQVGFDYLKKLGFTTIVDSRTTESGQVFSDINLSMALGGITDGVTNLQLTAGFAAIANSGVYTEPTFYTKILDHDGKVLLESDPVTNQVMKESTSYLLTNAMEDVVVQGTGSSVKFPNINMPIAGKTGTTSDDNDLWFAGYTPYYTATIWSGFDNNLTQTNKTYHKIIWRDIMERIHTKYKLETVPFTMPDSVVSAKICTKSGKLAVDGLCDEYIGGSTVKTEYFSKGTVPTEKCDVHVKVTVCKDSKKIANDFCPLPSLEEIVYLAKKETAKTNDTQYILPTDICNIHTEASEAVPTITPYPSEDEDHNIGEDPITGGDPIIGDDPTTSGDPTIGGDPVDNPANVPPLDDANIEYYYDNFSGQ